VIDKIGQAPPGAGLGSFSIGVGVNIRRKIPL
jgi:hypothetical protein